MEGCSNKDVASPQLLDLIPRERNWFVQGGEGKSHGSSDEKKLELRLGPPGEEEREESSNLSHGYFSNNNQNRGIYTYGGNRGFTNTFEMKTGENNGGWIMKQQQHSNSGTVFSLLQLSPQGRDIKAKESSQSCSIKGEDLQKNAENNSKNKKVFSPGSANPAVATNSSQKRTAPAPVVGWPPIRSFRKNLASNSSSKLIPESQNVALNKELSEKATENCRKGYFVKINMDGVPIGRKVDLKAYDSYEKLSSSVDELFRGLLAAQTESSPGGIQNKQEGDRVITGLLDGSGEYTLVYEDNEGDRMLVGDVPWHMFVSTVKRLRVLKTSELSTLRCGNKKEKIPS